jgi:magnesium chelatase subunit I
VKTPTEIPARIEVVRRRDRFERDPEAFTKHWAHEDRKLRKRIVAARDALGKIDTPDAALERAARLCIALGTDGLRGELTLVRAARALAAYEGDETIADAHLRRVAPMALSHRLRRNPLDDSGSATRVNRAIGELFGA